MNFRSMWNALIAPSSGNNNPVYESHQSAFQSSIVQNVQPPHNVFHGCTVNFNTIHQNVVKRKRVVIESDSSQSQD